MVEKQLEKKCDRIDEKSDLSNSNPYIVEFKNHKNVAKLEKKLKNPNVTVLSGMYLSCLPLPF